MRFIIRKGRDGKYRWFLKNDHTARGEAMPCGPGFATAGEVAQAAFNIVDAIREGGDVYAEDGSIWYR